MTFEYYSQRRIQAGINGWVPWIRSKKPKPDSDDADDKDAGIEGPIQRLFAFLGPTLTRPAAKVSVLAAAAALAAVGAWGNVLLTQEFDPMWFLPTDSYLAEWARVNDR